MNPSNQQISSGNSHPRVLLTGGSGFLGKMIVSELFSPGSPLTPSLLRIFDCSDYTGQADQRIEFIRGDIRNRKAVTAACRDIDLVIHSAAIVDWGTKPEKEVLETNFGGTENLVQACLEQKVGFLIYTSSLDAIFGGKSLVNIDETIPYPEHHPNMYCRSKYLSEKLVMESCNAYFKTCVLRPADIYGEEDPFHIGSLINMAKGGFYVRLGDGTSRSQHVYVRNMAWAHVQAAGALISGNETIPGNAYFITDGPPANFFHFFDRIVMESGYRIRPGNLWIPRRIAYFMGWVSEAVALLIRPIKKYAPKFSRFAVIYTCSDFTFSSEKAKRDFNFSPKYPVEESISKTVAYYKKQK